MSVATLSHDPASMLNSTRAILAYVDTVSASDDPVLAAHALLVASRALRRLAGGPPTSPLMIRADDGASLLLALLDLARQGRLVPADVSPQEGRELRDALSLLFDGR